jgi:hypothetical protein
MYQAGIHQGASAAVPLDAPAAAVSPANATEQKIIVDIETPITEAVEKIGPAVVTVIGTIPGQNTVFGRTPDHPVSGSGVIIAEQGYILTNNHVVEDTQSLSVIFADGREAPAQLVGRDAFSDIAVLKVEGEPFLHEVRESVTYRRAFRRIEEEKEREEQEKKTYERLVFRLSFEGADPKVEVIGQKERGGKVNYFIGSKKNWHSNIPIFDEVLYRNIYPGVNLKFYLEGSNPRHVFTLKPGVNPSVIRLSYAGGVDQLSLNPEGGLSILTSFGAFPEKAPTAYQEIDGKRVERAVSYEMAGEKDVILKVPDFDSRYPLVIR